MMSLLCIIIFWLCDPGEADILSIPSVQLWFTHCEKY